jgi:Zn-dependent peptidase ImmA (M78 family)
MVRVEVKGEMLRWARERSGLTSDVLLPRFPKLKAWEVGKLQPTLKQLEDYARATFTPVGFLFLPVPPEESVPIPDFRTMGGKPISRPSPNLLDMIYACQQRQDWFRDHARTTRLDRLEFVGSATIEGSVEKTASDIRHALGFDIGARAKCPTWADALRLFIAQADQLGVLVMCSGIVMNNTHRRLDPEEFRGFALADDLAPLVFINGADSKSAQMFTLAHELAHIWLGATALSDATVATRVGNPVERWCNRVAAELLAPLDAVRNALHGNEQIDVTVTRLARQFKVSSLVVLQRLRDVGHLTWDEFDAAYNAELLRLAKLPKPEGGGGDFYATAAVRYSRRFTRALFESTSEGRTLYRDALRLLGISKTETFNELGRSLAFGG